KIPPSKSDPWVWWRPPDAAAWNAYITTPRQARHRLRDAMLPRVKGWRQHPPPPNERNFTAPEWAAVVFARLGTTSSDASAGLLRGLLDGYVLPPQHGLLLDLQADRIGPHPQRVWEAFAAAWEATGSSSSSHAGPVAVFL